MATTKTDPGAIARTLDDVPSQLREWGTHRVFPLPPHRVADWIIGASPDCWIQLQDREQFVSRRHAVLRLVDDGWHIADAGSKNGLWIDGQRAESSPLLPGIEVGIGRVRLIVESPAIVRRRALLCRFLGWHPERRPIIDRALRAIRELVAGRFPLWLTGGDDLVAIARRIHRELDSEPTPFVVAELETGARSIEAALRNARGGTLCFWARRMPAHARLIRSVIADREHACRVIVCARSTEQAVSIDVPPLASRLDEIEQVIDEYAIDAIAQLGAKPASFANADREWLLTHPPDTLAEIEESTLRMIAIREFGGVTHAAPRLGITHSALSRWLARRFARPRRRKS